MRIACGRHIVVVVVVVHNLQDSIQFRIRQGIPMNGASKRNNHPHRATSSTLVYVQGDTYLISRRDFNGVRSILSVLNDYIVKDTRTGAASATRIRYNRPTRRRITIPRYAKDWKRKWLDAAWRSGAWHSLRVRQ
jgi:hypothetical protein